MSPLLLCLLLLLLPNQFEFAAADDNQASKLKKCSVCYCKFDNTLAKEKNKAKSFDCGKHGEYAQLHADKVCHACTEEIRKHNNKCPSCRKNLILPPKPESHVLETISIVQARQTFKSNHDYDFHPEIHTLFQVFVSRDRRRNETIELASDDFIVLRRKVSIPENRQLGFFQATTALKLGTQVLIHEIDSTTGRSKKWLILIRRMNPLQSTPHFQMKVHAIAPSKTAIVVHVEKLEFPTVPASQTYPWPFGDDELSLENWVYNPNMLEIPHELRLDTTSLAYDLHTTAAIEEFVGKLEHPDNFYKLEDKSDNTDWNSRSYSELMQGGIKLVSEEHEDGLRRWVILLFVKSSEGVYYYEAQVFALHHLGAFELVYRRHLRAIHLPESFEWVFQLSGELLSTWDPNTVEQAFVQAPKDYMTLKYSSGLEFSPFPYWNAILEENVLSLLSLKNITTQIYPSDPYPLNEFHRDDKAQSDNFEEYKSLHLGHLSMTMLLYHHSMHQYLTVSRRVDRVGIPAVYRTIIYAIHPCGNVWPVFVSMALLHTAEDLDLDWPFTFEGTVLQRFQDSVIPIHWREYATPSTTSFSRYLRINAEIEYIIRRSPQPHENMMIQRLWESKTSTQFGMEYHAIIDGKIELLERPSAFEMPARFVMITRRVLKQRSRGEGEYITFVYALPPRGSPCIVFVSPLLQSIQELTLDYPFDANYQLHLEWNRDPLNNLPEVNPTLVPSTFAFSQFPSVTRMIDIFSRQQVDPRENIMDEIIFPSKLFYMLFNYAEEATTSNIKLIAELHGLALGKVILKYTLKRNVLRRWIIISKARYNTGILIYKTRWQTVAYSINPQGLVHQVFDQLSNEVVDYPKVLPYSFDDDGNLKSKRNRMTDGASKFRQTPRTLTKWKWKRIAEEIWDMLPNTRQTNTRPEVVVEQAAQHDTTVENMILLWVGFLLSFGFVAGFGMVALGILKLVQHYYH